MKRTYIQPQTKCVNIIVEASYLATISGGGEKDGNWTGGAKEDFQDEYFFGW